MAVETKEQFDAWLKQQSREVCASIAVRAALMVLPLVCSVERGSAHQRMLALMTFRAALASGVAAAEPVPDARAAAHSAADAALLAATRAEPYAVDAAAFVATDAAARSAGRAAHAAAGVDERAADAAIYAASRAAGRAAPEDAAEAAARTATYGAAYADRGLPANARTIFETRVKVPKEITAPIESRRVQTDLEWLLTETGEWSFWSRWYERAMAGDPLPWDLQREVALIPDEIWDAGPEAVAERIAEIEDKWAIQHFPQAEELVQQEDGRFEMRHVPDTPLPAQYTPLDPETALDAVISETSVAPKLFWDEERSVHRISHDPPFDKETITFVINRLERLLAAAISTSGNGITEHAYEAILIYAVLGDPHQDISLTATTLQDAWVSLGHNLSDLDPAYPSDPQHLNLRDALREAVEEICDKSAIAKERCKKLAKVPDIPITKEMRESAAELAEAAAEFTDEEARDVLEADAEGIVKDPHPPKSKVARFLNYVATIAKRAKEALDRAQGSVTYLAKLEKFVTKVTVWIKWLLENWPF